jgi:glycosyltransferase involved in cell wall biosynthesis
MKTTCLINNYNYKDYICEAIESALLQTYPFDEIIVVDDASTDGSVNLIKEKYGLNSSIELIPKKNNEGQLAAATTGFLQSKGDIIFFLDADDFYHPQYLEIALKIYKENPICGFLYCEMGIFSNIRNNYQTPSQSQISNYKSYLQDCGYSIILVMEEQRFVGSPSSGNSIQRKYLSKILPCPYIEYDRIWTDNCVVFGSSILGARKFLIKIPLVAYRLHDKNAFLNNPNRKDYERFNFYQNQIAIIQLITFLSHKMNYSRDLLVRSAPYEFKTIDNPTWDLFFDYLKIMFRISSSVPFSPSGRSSKLHGLKIMLKHMIIQKFWKR